MPTKHTNPDLDTPDMSYGQTTSIDWGQDGRNVADFSPEKSYNRQRVQGSHKDVDEYPYVARTR